MMNRNQNNLLQGQKVFAIEDKNSTVNVEFINSIEKS